MSPRRRALSSVLQHVCTSTLSPRRTSVPEPLWVNSSFASSSGFVIDTDEVSGNLSSRSLICSIFTRMPPLIHGCAINSSYSVLRLIESMMRPSPSSRPPVPVRKMILYGFSTRTSSLAAKSALTLRIWPPTVSPSEATTGIEPARRLASIGARFTRTIRPTRPSALRSMNSASNTPDRIEVARASACCNASTRFRFCDWNTRRTTPNVSGEVTRRPSTVCFAMPRAANSSSSCGPAPCTTIGVRPTCCRNASDEVSASRSSRSTAPPTLTTAKRFASTCEKRFRYWSISFALAMLESRRTMVWRT